MQNINRKLLWLLIALPPLYILWAIQYSALTYPFWDHIELLDYIESYKSGTLSLADLWKPHNHTRPFIYRTLYLVNAVMTDWDIRSEYIYMYMVIYGAFSCHVYTLWHLSKKYLDNRHLIILAAISSLFFSPVGHNNHWWSMMLQLNIANMFIIFSFMLIALNYNRWLSHILAAMACWAAAYTITNGLIAMVAVLITMQFAQAKPYRANKHTIFWAANLLILLALYVPGISLSQSAAKPGLSEFIQFFLAYLGSPLGGLLVFRHTSQFLIPDQMALNVILGGFLLICLVYFIFKGRGNIHSTKPGWLLMIMMSLFAIGSALITAWGRAAFDEYGVANANASRYTIYSVYLTLGILYNAVCLDKGSVSIKASWLSTRSKKVISSIIVTLIIVAVCITYVRSFKTYRSVHGFNQLLAKAYAHIEPSPLDRNIYPNKEKTQSVKHTLMALNLSPYKLRPRQDTEYPDQKGFEKAVQIVPNRTITQKFLATSDGLYSMNVKFTAPSRVKESFTLKWHLLEAMNDGTGNLLIAKGTLNSTRIKDWREYTLGNFWAKNSRGKYYMLEIMTDDSISINHPISVPLYSLNETRTSMKNVKISGINDGLDNLMLGLSLHYKQ